ncbi:hypothetical protein NG701_07575 [Pseudarthrobacter sp. HLT3-5]|uniref:hypothetical protein n=1 Tax=Pseudarthrobacter cellobiosi TaxID=2953654 RepID=UPI00208F2511|nr:hypothetical protein [Pseudarthrobacter sp. HLT3-5]MCO4274288.1 hypothetical protein [Pseudarthrobacter sp. HLT3-5]
MKYKGFEIEGIPTDNGREYRAYWNGDLAAGHETFAGVIDLIEAMTAIGATHESYVLAEKAVV